MSSTGFASAVEEDALFADIPAVITSTRMPQSVENAPLSVTVLDRATIEASGFVEIPDLFRLVPGFQVGLSWRDRHTAVTYHGQSDGLDRRLQVLIDGRAAVSTLFGLVDWDRLGITIDDIERIEVMRGPAGVYYGSNAFSGAINIITRDALTESGLRISTTAGSQGTQIVSASYSQAGKVFDYRINTSYFDTEGFDGVNDESRSRTLRLKGRYQLAAEDLLEFQLGVASGPWGRGGTGSVIDPVGDKDADEQYGSLRYTRTHSPGNEWYLQVEMSVSEEDDEFTVGRISELLAISPVDVPALFAGQPDQVLQGNTFDYTSTRQDVEFQQLNTWAGGQRTMWGLGYRKDSVEGIATIGTSDEREIETYRVYGSLEYDLSDRLLVNAGFMHEDTNINRGRMSFRFGTNYQLDDNQSLRVAYAENYRHPFVAEAFHNVALRFEDETVLEQVGLAPEPLTPERVRSYEIGHVGHWLGGELKTEIKLFREESENEVEYVPDLSVPELISVLPQIRFNEGAILDVNGGATDITGVEGNLDWQILPSTRLWVSYSFAETAQSCMAGAIRCLHANDATPQHTASALLSHNFGEGWKASLGYYFLDEMAWIRFGGDRDSYGRIDARIAKIFNLGSADLMLELIGQNLGSDYKEFSDLNTFETRTFVRATLQFH